MKYGCVTFDGIEEAARAVITLGDRCLTDADFKAIEQLQDLLWDCLEVAEDEALVIGLA